MAPNDLGGSNYRLPARRTGFAAPPSTDSMRHFHHGPGSAGGGNISHTFLLWVLRQWWMIVVPVGFFLAIVSAVAVLYLHVPKYEASALLMIEDTNPFIAFAARDLNSDSKSYVQTQLELLRSHVVLEPVLSDPGIAAVEDIAVEQDPVKFLRGQLAIEQIGESELYTVSYKSPSPESAAKVVNAVVAEYMDLLLGDEFQRSQRVIDILEEERRRRELEVERLRKRVVELAKQVTGRDPFDSNEVTDINRALSPVGSLFQSLTVAEVDLQVRRAELQSLVDAPALAAGSSTMSAVIDLEVENQAEIREKHGEIQQVEARMAEIKLAAVRFHKTPQWESDPTFVALKNEWNQRRTELSELKSKLQNAILTQRRERYKEDQAQKIAEAKRDLQVLEARREFFAKKFAEQVNDVQSGGGQSVELEFARAELEREEKVFELIASRKLALQTELRAPARVQLRQKANVPKVPAEPIPYKLLLLACAGTFAAPFGLAVLREMMVRRISDVEQLSQESRLRVLGEIAALPVRYLAVSPNQLSARLRRDTYIFAESINSLRTNLDLAEGSGDRQVLAVTSAAPSEGKTSVAVSLAMSIANSKEQPTLIIDGDMRSPTVATMLKTKSSPGLFEVLSNTCAVDDAIQRVGQSSLYVIPGGRAIRSTHSVVGINEIEQLLGKLRDRFSSIIIDTPPILGASESLVLAKAADSVLLCSLCNVSKVKQIRLAVDRLGHAQVNIAGTVLSGTPAKRYEYVYGYYANRLEAGN